MWTHFKEVPPGMANAQSPGRAKLAKAPPKRANAAQLEWTDAWKDSRVWKRLIQTEF